MQVIDALAAVFPAVPDEPITLSGDATGASHLGGHHYHMPGERAVCARELVERRDVYARNDEHVHRSLRVHVLDRDDLGIVMHASCGDLTADDPTEDACRVRAARGSHRFTIAAAAASVKRAAMAGNALPVAGCSAPC